MSGTAPMRSPQAPCPWLDLDDDGTGLDLEDFLSFHVVRLASALQRTTFRAYLDPHGLSPADWRVLGLVRRYGPIRFAEAVERTGLDKAQVSRTVRHLGTQGWLATQADAGHAQRLTLSLTSAGRRLHDRILPQAARAQAGLLRALPATQRRHLWDALQRLQALVAQDAQAAGPSDAADRGGMPDAHPRAPRRAPATAPAPREARPTPRPAPRRRTPA